LNIGENIKRYRIEKAMTINELASTVGVTPSTISRYETQNREPSLSILSKIATSLGVTIANIVTDSTITNKIIDFLDIELFENFNLEKTLESICNIIDINLDTLHQYLQNEKELPEKDLLILFEFLLKKNPVLYTLFVSRNLLYINRDIKIAEKAINLIENKKEHLETIPNDSITENARIVRNFMRIEEIINKMEKYSLIFPGTEKNLIDKILELIDYEIYKKENETK